MALVKVKKSKDVFDLFNGMLQGFDAEDIATIILPKYEKLGAAIAKICKLLQTMTTFDYVQRYPECVARLIAICATFKQQYAAAFVIPDISTFVKKDLSTTPYDDIPEEILENIHKSYTTAKSCNLVNVFIVLCSNLTPIKAQIANVENLSDSFICKSAALTFCPLPDVPQLNFKQLYIDDRSTADDKHLLLLTLHKLYTLSHDIYDIASSPDVNIQKFIEMVVKSISVVRKQIPRCDGAFKKIIESVHLLESNFGSYYKDFSSSGNATVIMENFIVDVSKSTNADIQTAGQFKRIIAHYKKMSTSHGPLDPKMQTLFTIIDDKFAEYDSSTGASSTDAGLYEEFNQ